MSVQMEVKSQITLTDRAQLSCKCGAHAIMTVAFGEVQNRYSSGDPVDLCENPDCFDEALGSAVADLCYLQANRRELAAQERYDLREGK